MDSVWRGFVLSQVAWMFSLRGFVRGFCISHILNVWALSAWMCLSLFSRFVVVSTVPLGVSYGGGGEGFVMEHLHRHM